MTVSLQKFLASDLAVDPSLVIDDDAIAHPHDFRKLGGNQDDRHALHGRLGNQGVNLRLGADIHAARRLVEDQDLGVEEHPFGKHDLLLIAAAERIDIGLDAGCLEGELFRDLPDVLGFRAGANPF